MISLLSRGLNFNPYATGDICQTKVDIFKFIRNLKIKKHFAGSRDTQGQPVHIPNVFDEVSLTIKDVQATHLLLSLTDREDSPLEMETLLTDLDIETDYSIASGLKNKSKWTPTLPGGNVIDNFHRLVLDDLNRVNTKNLNTKFKFKDNLTRGERLALSTLRENRDIIIREADKGGNVVVMNLIDYNNEIQGQLNDNSCYELLNHNPIGPLTLLVNGLLLTWKQSGLLDDNEYLYLKIFRPTYPWFYTLPKIHKKLPFPPGRPIVSGIGGPTERLAEYVDLFLGPLVRNLPSYIQDSKHILSIMADMEWQQGTMLVTLDVVSLYTSINPALGLEAISKILSNRPASLWAHTNMLLHMTKIILENNFFIFDRKWYRQKKGVAMGSKFSPSFANLFMGALESDLIWGTKGMQYIDSIVFWGRYIDDCFLLWSGSEELLHSFFEYLNSNTWEMSFTMKHSLTSMEFLDLDFYIKDNKIHSKLYRKPTACNAVLHASSFHPEHQLRSIPYGEFLRARRNCSETNEFEQCITGMKDRFLKRGYPKASLKIAERKTRTISRPDCLKTRTETNSSGQQIRLITEYNALNYTTKKSFNRHWKLLKDDPVLKTFLPDRPAITYKRGFTLKNKLSPTVPPNTGMRDWLSTKGLGFYKCGSCSMCIWGKHGTTTFKGPDGSLYKIKHNITCLTKFVVYLIECKCGKIYVGSTIRALKDRVGEHMRAIQKRDPRYPVALHVAECQPPEEDFKVRVFGIDVIPLNIRGGNRELTLRRREATWILRLQSVEHGLNYDPEMQYFLGD